jgi:hypothetical protein
MVGGRDAGWQSIVMQNVECRIQKGCDLHSAFSIQHSALRRQIQRLIYATRRSSIGTTRHRM